MKGFEPGRPVHGTVPATLGAWLAPYRVHRPPQLAAQLVAAFGRVVEEFAHD
jgi:hypothetical protein